MKKTVYSQTWHASSLQIGFVVRPVTRTAQHTRPTRQAYTIGRPVTSTYVASSIRRREKSVANSFRQTLDTGEYKNSTEFVFNFSFINAIIIYFSSSSSNRNHDYYYHTHASLCPHADWQDNHSGRAASWHHPDCQASHPRQGGNPTRPATPHLRRQAARRRPLSLRLQHPEGVHTPLGAPSAWRPLMPSLFFHSCEHARILTVLCWM